MAASISKFEPHGEGDKRSVIEEILEDAMSTNFGRQWGISEHDIADLNWVT
jgi:hypothetical protein